METPKPVSLDKLRGILGGAKKIMDKVESGNYEKGFTNPELLREDGIQSAIAEGGLPHKEPSIALQTITPERIAASKMPEAIKKAMLENPIPQATMGHTFTLEDVADFAADEKPIPYQNPKANTQRKTAQPINENRMAAMAGLSEAQIRTIVKDEIIEFLTKYFTKSLSEDVQNKVIKQLLESGKIKVKR